MTVTPENLLFPNPVLPKTSVHYIAANPRLSWRDIQHLIVYGSTLDEIQTTNANEWRTNGAGLKFSHTFGFGVMNAKNMIDLARKWPETSNEFKRCEFSNQSPQATWEPNAISLRMTLDDCGDSGLTFVEQAEVLVNVSYRARGNVQITLISPAETESDLLVKRLNDVDDNSDTLKNFPLTSVHFWGESPTGTWTIRVSAFGIQTYALKSVKMVLYGDAESPFNKAGKVCFCPGDEEVLADSNLRHEIYETRRKYNRNLPTFTNKSKFTCGL